MVCSYPAIRSMRVLLFLLVLLSIGEPAFAANGTMTSSSPSPQPMPSPWPKYTTADTYFTLASLTGLLLIPIVSAVLSKADQPRSPKGPPIGANVGQANNQPGNAMNNQVAPQGGANVGQANNQPGNAMNNQVVGSVLFVLVYASTALQPLIPETYPVGNICVNIVVVLMVVVGTLTAQRASREKIPTGGLRQ
eukprot:TRINITY_DN261_c0_g1_i1.p1 TRINITY_DN261_c0_g1~~TRINITY_DN261_c0_g1_i1.p1  ORF type:complete len:193 (-),score=3.61 TRINITY_DN261_c0_g1_i1:113-691(-)